MKRATVHYNDLMWVSLAKENELGDIVNLLKSLAEEEGFSHYLPSNLEDLISKLIKDETVLCLRRDSSTVVGLLIYTVHMNPLLLFKKSIAQELVWCVKKEHRKYSFMLLDTFESKARDNGCTHTVLAVTEEHKRNRVLKKLYSLNGYNVFETMYEKELT